MDRLAGAGIDHAALVDGHVQLQADVVRFVFIAAETAAATVIKCMAAGQVYRRQVAGPLDLDLFSCRIDGVYLRQYFKVLLQSRLCPLFN